MRADGSTPLNVLGVDVGGTKVAVARVVGARADAVVEHPTQLAGAEALIDGIERAVAEAVGDGERPAMVGVGMPSQIDQASGTVVSSVNIPVEGIPLRDELARRLGAPVVLDNDANCAALAEAQLVEGGPARHLVMYTLGTGVGGGVVIDGRVFRGATGLGAELGHVVVDASQTTSAGTHATPGSLESLCSGTSLEGRATALARERPDSALGRIAAETGGRVKGRRVVAAAEAGDPDARRLLDDLGRWLGIAIANAINAFEPEHVVVGGGLSRAGHLFMDAAHREAAERALPALAARVKVSLARGGAEAGVIGAGVLAAQELARMQVGTTTTGEGAR